MTITRRFFYITVLPAVLFILCSCAGKQSAQPELILLSKEEVLLRLSSSMPEACEYLGRTSIQFADNRNRKNIRAILDKSCSGDMDIKILGPFGIQMAEILVSGNEYAIFQNGKNVTAKYPINIDAADIVLLKNYLTLPPPLPDERYTFISNTNQYIFTLEDEYISVTPDLYVNNIFRDDHEVYYLWKEGVLKAIRFFRNDAEVVVEFIDPWKEKK